MEKCKFLQILACSTGIKKSVKFSSSVRDCLGKFCIPTLQVYTGREREDRKCWELWTRGHHEGGWGGSGSGPRNSPTCQPPPLPPSGIPFSHSFEEERGGGRGGWGEGKHNRKPWGWLDSSTGYWLGWVNMYQIFIFRFNLHPKVLKQANFRGSSQKSLADI